jgi:3-dehydroquinate dehydratase II
VRAIVLNGVNLDQLGKRNPDHYGGLTLSELETRIYEWANELECSVRCRQTNSEGEFVEWIHDAAGWADGVIVNPGAWTHYSWAIHDALELVTGPIVEVHLSNVEAREEWRKLSVVSDLVATKIAGKGPEGYREALEFLCKEAS